MVGQQLEERDAPKLRRRVGHEDRKDLANRGLPLHLAALDQRELQVGGLAVG